MKNPGLVSAKRIESYDPDLLYSALTEQFLLLGLAEELTPQTRVLLKPNLLTGRDPQEAITTHPAVVAAVVRWLHAHGVTQLVLADSPGGVFTAQRMKGIYHICGLDTLEGIQLNFDTGWQTRFLEQGVVCKSFNQLNPVCNADLIINLAKLKTHGMTTMSGGMKNLFGTIPGLQKPEMHYLYPQKERFSGMLVDLSLVVAPAVTVIDAIDAMEGEGPSGGTVRHMGYLFAANDLYAQDYAAARAIGLDPMTVDMIRLAAQRGLFDPAAVRVVGDQPENIPPFALPRSTSLLFADRIPKPLRNIVTTLAKKLLRPTPKVITDKCIGCGRCAESCPPHTIVIRNKKACIDLRHCISCFCCHEMCPVKAITVQRRMKI
ncbi:MAG: DUF362 domain-containing protein [Angelakisella sp.]